MGRSQDGEVVPVSATNGARSNARRLRYNPAMRVTKMHGLGNDYVYVLPTEERDWPALSVRVSDRHFGVGSDGLILALPSKVADMRMRMFNADGSEAEMCGNGIRCVVKFALEEGLVPAGKREVRVETLAGVKTLQVLRE